jgi:hypothetical protein
MALCPKHPKILNHFGEFLESSEGQILQVRFDPILFVIKSYPQYPELAEKFVPSL